MVTKEELKGVVFKKTREDGLVMSRVPKPTRDKFIAFSEEQFSGDRGMALKALWDQYELWIVFMNNWDLKLDHILLKMDEKQPQVEKEPKKRTIRMLGGNSIERGVKE